MCRLVPECPDPSVRCGYCWRHYHRKRKYKGPGEAEPLGKWACIETRFWNRVQRYGPLPDDHTLGVCYMWTGPATNGYGLIGLNHKHIYVHRYAYEQAYGPIPPRCRIKHRCGNTLCVRPDHLQLRTPACPDRLST